MKPLALLLVALSLSGCVGKPPLVEVKLDIRLPAAVKANARRGYAPATATGFNCLAVNVMGAGISESASAPNADTASEIVSGGYCSYPGVMSQLIPIATSGEITLKIPAGNDRVIQLLGVMSSDSTCTKTLPEHFDDIASPLFDSQYPGIYELGRTVVNVNSSQKVSITNTYDSSNPLEVRCSTVPFNCADPVINLKSPFAGGLGTAAEPYRICTATQFANIGSHLNKVFKLDDDVDLQDVEWTPMGTAGTPFSGQLDGNSHTVHSFQITSTSSQGAGLFAVLSGSVTNLFIDDYTIVPSTAPAAGGLTAYNSGTIDAVIASNGAVTVPNNGGGLVGINSGTITNSSSSATIAGIGTLGGFVGSNSGDITDCSALAGSVTSTGGGSEIGGFAGVITSGTVSGSFSTASVAATTSTYVGGFVGSAYGISTVIERSYATGNVSGGNHYFGGFVGNFANDADIADCYARGDVSASGLKVGGFVGLLSNSAAIVRSYTNTPNVTGGGDVGAFGGTSSAATVADVFSSSLVAQSGGGFAGTALSPPGFNLAANFTNFNFVTVWDNTGDTVPPFLR